MALRDLTEALDLIFMACGAAGHDPAGLSPAKGINAGSPRARMADACEYIAANSAPKGEEKLWAIATTAAKGLESAFAKADAASKS